MKNPLSIRHFAILIFSCLLSAACTIRPIVYSQDAIEARVVDLETRESLEGVGVLATWEMWDTIGTSTKLLRYADAVTDKDGRFRVEKWGPLPRNPRYILRQQDPHLWFVQPGYLALHLNNAPLTHKEKEMELHEITLSGRIREQEDRYRSSEYDPWGYSSASQRECYWSGKTIGLERSTDAEKEAGKLHSMVPGSYDRAILEIIPTTAPHFWKAYLLARERLPEKVRFKVEIPFRVKEDMEKRK